MRRLLTSFHQNKGSTIYFLLSWCVESLHNKFSLLIINY